MYPVTTGEVLRHLRLPIGSIGSFGIALSPDQRRRLKDVLPVNDDFLDASVLTAFNKRGLSFPPGTLEDPQRAATATLHSWANPRCSGCCPRCLDEEPVWPTRWRMFWTAACRAHGTVLIDRCEACCDLLMSGGSRSAMRSRPTQCRCGLDIRRMEAQPATDLLLQAQVDLDDALEGRRVPLAGDELSAHAFFEVLEAVAYVMRLSGWGFDGDRWGPATEPKKLPAMSRLTRDTASALTQRVSEILIRAPESAEAGLRLLYGRARKSGLTSSTIRLRLMRSGLPLDEFGVAGRILTIPKRDL